VERVGPAAGRAFVTGPTGGVGADKIRVAGVHHSFPTGQGRISVLDGVDLTVADGEFVSIIGPSGCGKSTLFNILAGLEVPDSGSVLFHGADATGRTEHFAYMPQKDLLLPWRRVIDNASLGLEVQGLSRKQARAKAGELFATFGLAGFERSWPSELSGGMRQRVALLRTVVQRRSVLLLDEPFGALDSLTRTEMQMWLTSVWERYHWTVILITHDIREAVFLSDRVYALTARPSRVGSEHVVDLPRPRTLEMYADPRAAAVEVELLSALGADRAGAPAGTDPAAGPGRAAVA
jgi:ABC-type nitrate/sulfonate/bicarbonate transport system ATPase subunit